MAMAEPREWHHHDEDGARHAEERARLAEERARVAEEQRLQSEGRCFAAERRRLDAERRLEQVEQLLEEARLAGARMQTLVGELSALAAALRRVLERGAVVPVNPGGQRLDPEDVVSGKHRAEMVDALAAAVERLRARVDEVKAVERSPAAAVTATAASVATAPQTVAARPPHKHSMSALGRWRNKRKQRRNG